MAPQASQSVANIGWQKPTYNVPILDTAGWITAAGNAVKPTKTGLYLAYIRLQTNGISLIRAAIGTDTSRFHEMGNYGTSQSYAIAATAPFIYNDLTDELKPWVYATASSPINNNQWASLFGIIGPIVPF